MIALEKQSIKRQDVHSLYINGANLMRRSICYCEPSYALAGEIKTWKFIYTPSSNLPKGTRLKFDLQTKGREIDWQIPSTNLKKGDDLIYGLINDQKVIQANEIFVADSFTPQYEFILPSALSAGDSFTIILGAKSTDINKKGAGSIHAQTTSQRRRPFLLYIDPTGKGHYGEPEVFSMDIKGAELANIRILTPSYVAKNKRFDIIVRFEDEFGNLTNSADEDTLIELSHEHLRENLTWKLFVPETGFITLPNLYFNEPGFYTIRLLNTFNKKEFFSAPIKCFAESNKHMYWGLLHGESDRFDSTENIESCMRHFRDDKAYNFYGVSPFESQEETSNDTWKFISQNVADFNEEDRFTTFLGMQWAGDAKSEGLRHIIYTKDSKPILRKKDLKSNTLKKIYKSFSPKEIISIPSFTMSQRTEFNFEQFDPDFERVVEIYNAWGSSECSKKEGNLFPIASQGATGTKESVDGSIQKALQRNCRFGFVAGGLDDRGIFSDLFDSEQEQYTSGYTGIIAPAHNRDALIEALYQRSCYATTGERMIVGLYLAGIPMGKETSTVEKPGLLVNRHLSGYAAGTTKLTKVELIRNGKVIQTFTTDTYHLEFTYDDMEPLDKVSINAKDKKPHFSYYYLRVVQEDGHVAWSSPIWVDYIPASAIPKQPKIAKPLAKPVAQLESFDDDLDDDLDEDDYDDDLED